MGAGAGERGGALSEKVYAEDRDTVWADHNSAAAREWETTSSAPIPFGQTIALFRSFATSRPWRGPLQSAR